MSTTTPLTEAIILNIAQRLVYWRTSYAANIDTLTTPGQYYTSSTTACEDPPTKGWVGILEVFYRGTKPMQRITATDGIPYIHIRAMRDNGSWFPWHTYIPDI